MSQKFDPRVDYYAILGLTPQATVEQIKSAYRHCSLTAHPDAGGSRDAFLRGNQAYEFLRDKQVRAAYDAARQPAATPAVIHHWQQAARRAAKSAATVTEHFEHDLKGFDAWVYSMKKDFAAANYGQQQEGRYSYPTVENSKSGTLFVGRGRFVGAIVGMAVAMAAVDELRRGDWHDLRKVAYVPLYVGIFQWMGAGVGKFLHESIRNSVVAHPDEKVIYSCTCGQTLRMPRIVGVLAVTCKRCNRYFGLQVSATGVREVCPWCKSGSSWDGARCKACVGGRPPGYGPVPVLGMVLGVAFAAVGFVGLAACAVLATSLTPWWYAYTGWGTGLWFVLAILVLGIMCFRMWMPRARWTPEGKTMGIVCLPLAMVMVGIIGAVPASGWQLEAVAKKYAQQGNPAAAAACWERLRDGSDRGALLHFHAQRALAKYYSLEPHGLLDQLMANAAAKDSGYASEAESFDALAAACSSTDADPCGLTNDTVAAKYFERAASLGNGHAMYALAMAYQEGRGVKNDEDAAAAWLIKAVQAESPDAMECLGSALVLEGNPAQQAAGIQWLTKAAAKENVAAMRELAACYRAGKAVAKDSKEAERWEREVNMRETGEGVWSTVSRKRILQQSQKNRF
jgi:hypothetical protein